MKKIIFLSVLIPFTLSAFFLINTQKIEAQCAGLGSCVGGTAGYGNPSNCGSEYTLGINCYKDCTCDITWQGSCSASPSTFCQFNGGTGACSVPVSCPSSSGPGPGPSSTFSLGVSPVLNITYPNGSPVTYTVTISPSSYTGTVNLSNEGTCPTGASCSFSPNPVVITDANSKTSTLSVSVGAGTPIGSYSITAKGTDGSKTSSATASLEVKPNPVATCGDWKDIPWGTNSSLGFYGIILMPGSVFASAGDNSGVSMYSPFGYSGVITLGGFQYNKCSFGTGVCLWSSLASTVSEDYLYPVNNLYAESPNNIYVKKNTDTHRWNGSWSNQGSANKPWDSPHSLTDKDGRLWEFRVVNSKGQYKCSNPTFTGTISASPNPIQTCNATGVTNISATANTAFEVRLGNPPSWGLFTSQGANVNWTGPTGDWVSDGTLFNLVKTGTSNVMGSVTVNLSCARPDLTASVSAPTTAIAGTAQTFTSTISNIGTAGTGANFNNFFQIATSANGGGTITDKTSSSMSALAINGTGTASVSHTFATAGTYSIRACADKSSSTNAGVVTESNENNNCGSWTNVTVSAVTSCGGSGSIKRDYWTNIGGSNFVSALTSNSNYPNSPSGTNNPTSFEAPTDWADNYGTRMYGFVHSQTTGSYTFYISSDDYSELWLSTNDNPSNKVKIASVNGWTPSRSWTINPSQYSSVNLTSGQKYYIEALQKEGNGGDNLAVGWKVPGSSAIEVIPGACLSPYTSTPTCSNGANNFPTCNTCSSPLIWNGSSCVSATTPVVYINSTPAAGVAPLNIVLDWNVSGNPTPTCTASGDWSGAKAVSGTQTINNLTAGTKSYTLTCTNSAGSNSGIKLVNVNAQSLNTLTVTKSGQGTITGTGINCGSDCTETYTSGTNVTLTAAPSANRIFTGWTVNGDKNVCPRNSIPQYTCSINMSSSKTVKAFFPIDPTYREF